MTTLRRAVQDYLALRRAMGFKLKHPGTALSDFVCFLEREGVCHITIDLAVRWAKQSQHAHPAWWAKRLSYVRHFAQYRSATDPRTEVPPSGLLPHKRQRPAPYIYTDEEIRRLLEAAKNLSPPKSLHRWTYYTIFGLLVVTGIRISEILALNREDVDLEQDLLTIRLTKFGKSRLVPIHESTRNVLKQYARQRDVLQPTRMTSGFFISRAGKRLSSSTVRSTFLRLSSRIGLRDASRKIKPRLHDFRHHFAVDTMMHWYRSGLEVERHLPVLSTYLGHTHVAHTYWYLSAVPELLALAGARLEKRWEGLP